MPLRLLRKYMVYSLHPFFLLMAVVRSCCRGLWGHMCGTSVSSCYYKTDANINGVNLFLHAKSFQMHWLKMVDKYKKKHELFYKNRLCFLRTVIIKKHNFCLFFPRRIRNNTWFHSELEKDAKEKWHERKMRSYCQCQVEHVKFNRLEKAGNVVFCMDEVSTGSAILSGKRHCPAFWFWYWQNLTISSGYSAFIFYLTTCKREEALLAVELLRLRGILSKILLMEFFIHCAIVKPHSL